MNDLTKFHDEMLDYENDIVSDAEFLSAKRTKMIRKNDKDIAKEVVGILNAIIDEAERYKEFLLEQLN